MNGVMQYFDYYTVIQAVPDSSVENSITFFMDVLIFSGLNWIKYSFNYLLNTPTGFDANDETHNQISEIKFHRIQAVPVIAFFRCKFCFNKRVGLKSPYKQSDFTEYWSEYHNKNKNIIQNFL